MFKSTFNVYLGVDPEVIMDYSMLLNERQEDENIAGNKKRNGLKMEGSDTDECFNQKKDIYIRSLGQTVLSLSITLLGIFSGLLLTFSLDVFSSISWSLLLLPGILSVRGAVGGVFSARLSTSLHLGTTRASLHGLLT